MMVSKNILIFLLVGLMILGAVSAANYYASTTGSSSSSGSFNDPWDLITGLSNVGAGDVLYVMPGIYNGGFSVNADGTSESNRVIVQGYDPNNKPELIESTNSVTQTLHIGGDYVTVKDIIVRQPASGRRVIRVQGDYVTFDGIESYYEGGGSSGSNHNINVYSSSNFVLRNSLLDNSARNGLYISSSNNAAGSADNCLIENSEFRYMTTHHAINIFPSTRDVPPRHIYGCIIRNNYIHDIGGQSAFFLRHFNDFQIYNNVIINSGGGLSISSSDHDGYSYDANGLYANNLHVTNGGMAVVDWTANDLEIKNNIFYGDFYSNGQSIKFDTNYLLGATGPPIYGHDIDNNLYFPTNVEIYMRWNNSYVGNNANTPQETLAVWQQITGNDLNGLAVDPLIVNMMTGETASNSPVKDAGADLSQYFTTDYLGNAREPGSWDIGPYEIGASSGPECVDEDGDGYGLPGSSSCAYPQEDCAAYRPLINPGAEEVCYNYIDDDCNGYVDDECDTEQFICTTNVYDGESIKLAYESASAGSTICVNAGDYSNEGRIILGSVSGVYNNPIKIVAINKGVIIKGFKINADYIEIVGFEVTGSSSSGITVFGDNNVIRNNFIHDTSSYGMHFGSHNGNWDKEIMCSRGSNNVFKSNVIRGTLSEGISMRIFGSNNTVQGNDISRMGGGDGDGIRFFCSGHEIKNNFIHDNYADENQGGHMDCFQAYGPAWDILIESNVCDLPTGTEYQGLMLEQLTSFGHQPVENITFRYNVWRFSRPTGYSPAIVSVAKSSTNPPQDIIKNIVVEHNTVIRDTPAQYSLWFTRNIGAVAKNNIFYNGIVYNAAATNLAVPIRVVGMSQTDIDADYNLVFRNDGVQFTGVDLVNGLPKAPHDIWNVDPTFNDFVNGDYRPKATLADGSPNPVCDGGEGGSFIGALPCVGFHPADLNQNGCVDIGEIVAYVDLWKNGLVTIQQVVSGVEKWQQGCP